MRESAPVAEGREGGNIATENEDELGRRILERMQEGRNVATESEHELGRRILSRMEDREIEILSLAYG